MDYKKIISYIILGVFILEFGSVKTSFVVNGKTETERKRDEIKSKNDELSKSIGDARSQIDKQKAKKAEIDSKISDIQCKIDKNIHQISSLDKEVNEKLERIKIFEKEIEKNREIFKKGANIIFRTGGKVSALNILLNCSSMNDLVSAYHLIRSLNEHQNKAINALNENASKLNNEKQVLQEKRESIAYEKNQMESQKTELYELIAESNKIIEELKLKQEEETRQLDLNSQEIKNLDNEIAAYYARLEEERKEREKAEQQAREREQQKNSSGNGPIIMKGSSSGKGYTWPTPGFTTLTSLYNEDRGSYHHLAIDIGGYNIYGTPIVAAQSGVVITAVDGCRHYSAFCSCGGGYGNYVVIDHGNGYSTLYAHQSSVIVHSGQNVQKGQVIGYVGSTGHSTGPHLHYETRRYVNGRIERYNPMSEY